MATVYIPDSVLVDYAAESGSPEEAKERIQQIVAENAPSNGDSTNE